MVIPFPPVHANGSEPREVRCIGMELTQIRYFLSLAETLNFTRAADACGVTQPALTRAIQRLEEELGGPLLYRERSLTRLTPLGEAMRGHLRTIWDAANAARDTAEALRRGGRHRIRLGLVPSLALAPFMPVLAEVTRLRDGVDVRVRRGGPDDLFAGLLEDELDAAIVADGARMPDRLHRWPLFEEGFVVATAPDHPFAALASVPPGRLADTAVLRPLPEALELPADAVAQPAPEADHEDDALAMAGAGLGVAVVAARRPTGGDILVRPLDGSVPPRRIMLAVVAGRPRPPAVETFVRLARVTDWDAPAA
jgi:DNA-binding transcriptional LysR family regulator